VVLYGTEYWKGLLDWIRSRMLAEHKIKRRDLDLLVICDEPEQVVELFQEALADSARDLARTVGPDPQ
jgi:predicted Rossmann-fold nucleotide-binding protein